MSPWQKFISALGFAAVSSTSTPESRVVNDIVNSAREIAAALNSSGYNADFSLESLKEIDRFFDNQVKVGTPKKRECLQGI